MREDILFRIRRGEGASGEDKRGVENDNRKSHLAADCDKFDELEYTGGIRVLSLRQQPNYESQATAPASSQGPASNHVATDRGLATSGTRVKRGLSPDV
jgi:hypothetical protein